MEPFQRALTLLVLLAFLPLPGLAYKDQGEPLYAEALSLYEKLSTDPDNMNRKEIWDTLAKAFNNIYVEYPTSSRAPDALFLAGKMYEEIGTRFHSRPALEKAVELSRRFVRAYPYSSRADDALIRVARIVERWDKAQAYLEYERIVKGYKKGDMYPVARKKLDELKPYKRLAERKKRSTRRAASSRKGSRYARVRAVRTWSTEDYSRVVIHLDRPVSYKPHLLRPDPSISKPPRLYVDIQQSVAEPDLSVPKPDGGLLESIRVGNNAPGTVRAVLYIKSFKYYRVFSLRDPYRIVMDVYGKEPPPGQAVAKAWPTEAGAKKKARKRGEAPPPKTLRDVLGLKVRTIVIDPGHGGRDPGAVGPRGVKEKDVNLAIAKMLKKKLERHGIAERVILTRYDDRYIPLEERTAIARKYRADLFISIHCNASRDRKAHGIETYVLSFTRDRHSLAVAARENATNTRGLSDLQDILKKYLLSSKIDESMSLARKVQRAMVSHLSRKYRYIRSKGVKKAPFVVLIGADVPSILIETAFITNPREEKRLTNPFYVSRLAEGITEGIKSYALKTSTAYADY